MHLLDIDKSKEYTWINATPHSKDESWKRVFLQTQGLILKLEHYFKFRFRSFPVKTKTFSRKVKPCFRDILGKIEQ